MFGRRFPALAILTVLLVAPCSGVCHGWTSSNDARMACCAGKSAGDAEICCGSAEGRQNADPSGSTPVAALPPLDSIALKLASALAPQQPTASVIDARVPITNDTARHVLLSVFLI